ncbi:MAG: hypothetical protein KF891_07775 [Rhizobacter sp.]|nr:hypothetical protein [Rhizobacter sp.]
MEPTLDDSRARWNATRFVTGSPRGAYESWFQRANHPSRPLAFWIRYTVLSPRGRARDALGELWAVWFDGEKREVVAVKEEHPLSACRFSQHGLDATIAQARLDAAGLVGTAALGGQSIAWSLAYASGAAPLLLLPERLYEGSLPKAKVLVGAPLARYDGQLVVNGARIAIDGWVGSQNHNWGVEHTARYAWGQVAGFDDAPDAFLEVSTARVRVGPLLTPRLTVLVLRLDGEELRFTSIPRALRASGRYAPFSWSFETGDARSHLSGTVSAPAWSFVALPYHDPPGATKTCLNTKLARCELRVERAGRPARTLHTASRAAFELLSNDPPPSGVQRLAGGWP